MRVNSRASCRKGSSEASDEGCTPGKGRLVLVVGPSGVGKDSILDGARKALADNGKILFPRREITREPGLGGEDYIAVTPQDFRQRQSSGAYFLSWHAHGLDYGIPQEIKERVEAGFTVVVNVSRSAIGEARKLLPGMVTVAFIKASPEALRQRLLARGRETPEEIEERLSRAAAYAPPQTRENMPVVVINNNGPLEEAVRQFVSLLTDRTRQ